MLKIGIGYDLHRLVEDRKLFVGGVEIPSAKGLAGHSDGDVLIHAIIDAILGACTLGDIGYHFPDDDPQYEGISSVDLLSQIRQKIAQYDLQSRSKWSTPSHAAFLRPVSSS